MKKEILKNNTVVAALALFSCFLWGSAFPSIKIGYKLFSVLPGDTYGKIFFAGCRFLIASIMILIFSVLIKTKYKFSKEDIIPITVLGCIQTFIQYIFFYIGLSNTTGIKGSILSTTGIFFSVIISHFIYEEDKLSLNRILGVLLGFLGIIIVNLNGKSFDMTFKFTGEGFLIISTLASSLGGIFTKKFTKNIPPLILTGYQMIIGALLLILVGFVGNNNINLSISAKGIILLIYMAFISAAAFSIWSILLKHNSIGKISIFQFTIPLFGVFLSYIFINERLLGINVVIAVILVSLGIVLINKKNLKH